MGGCSGCIIFNLIIQYLIKQLKLTLGDFYYETRNNNEKNIMPASIRCSFNG